MKKIILSLIAVVAFFIAPAQKTGSSTYIKGSGTIGTIPMFSAVRTLSNSLIVQGTDDIKIGSDVYISKVTTGSYYQPFRVRGTNTTLTRCIFQNEGNAQSDICLSNWGGISATYIGANPAGDGFLDIRTMTGDFKIQHIGTDNMVFKSNATIQLFSVPTVSTGLPTGTIWSDSGTLKIMP